MGRLEGGFDFVEHDRDVTWAELGRLWWYTAGGTKDALVALTARHRHHCLAVHRGRLRVGSDPGSDHDATRNHTPGDVNARHRRVPSLACSR